MIKNFFKRFIISIKNLFPSFYDFKLVGDSILKSFLLFPFLIKKNYLYIIGLTLIQYLYFVFMIPSHVNDLILMMAIISWYFIHTLCLIVLVPVCLYNRNLQKLKSPSPPIIFKSLIKRIFMPLIIDPIKAFVILVIYSFFCSFIIYVAIFYFNLNITDPISLKLKIISTLAFSPVLIKSCQYLFIPFVIFFNKKYISEKTSSLKLSIEVSKGLALLLLILSVILSSVTNIDQSINFFNTYSRHFTSIVFSLSSIAFHFLSITFLTLIYFDKDRKNIL